MMETEQPIYSGDVEGVKAAAEELQRKRGDTETAEAVFGDDSDTKGPASDEKPLKVAEAAKGEMTPDGTAEFLVPINDRVSCGKRVWMAEEVLVIENTITVRVGHHHVGHVKILAFALVADGCRVVVPGTIAVVRVDVILAGKPTALRWIGPAFE